MVLRSTSEDETRRLGRLLGRCLQAPRTVLLEGDLGAGKTTLTKGLAEGLGLDPTEVHSPTFSLVHQYPGPAQLIHIDLYRLDSLQEQMAIGLEEFLDSPGIVIVEWAEKLALATEPALKIGFRTEGKAVRHFLFSGLRGDEERALAEFEGD